MARYTAEEASALILDGSEDQSVSDGSGYEIDGDPEFPLPHSDSDDQESQQPDSESESDEDPEPPSSLHRQSISPPLFSPSSSSEEESSRLSVRGLE